MGKMHKFIILILAWLRDQERSYDVLVYQCDYDMTPWTKWCLSEADIILDFNMAFKGSFVRYSFK